MVEILPKIVVNYVKNLGELLEKKSSMCHLRRNG